MIKATAAVDPPIIENIPEQLTERPQWVCWRREIRAGKSTKVPYTPGTERRASSTDLMTWPDVLGSPRRLRGRRATLGRHRLCVL